MFLITKMTKSRVIVSFLPTNQPPGGEYVIISTSCLYSSHGSYPDSTPPFGCRKFTIGVAIPLSCPLKREFSRYISSSFF